MQWGTKRLLSLSQKMHLLRCMCVYLYEKNSTKLTVFKNCRYVIVYYITESRGTASMWLLFCDTSETGLRLGIKWDTLLSSLTVIGSTVETFIYTPCLWAWWENNNKNQNTKKNNKLKSPENKHPAISFKVKYIKI